MSNNSGLSGSGHTRFTGTAILTALVAIVCVVAACVVALVYAGGGVDKSTPLIVTMLAVLGPVLTSLVTLIKVDQTRQDLHNGLIPDKIKEAAEEGHITVVEDRANKRTRSTDPDKRKDDPQAPDPTGTVD